MSGAEESNSLPPGLPQEDFSPPEGAGVSLDGRPTSSQDVLDLVVRFQMIGAQSQDLIEGLRQEMAGQSERLLAAALLERDYLTEDELETVVLARYLLACGKVTMAQLELVIDEIKETRAPLWVTLVAKGWLKMNDVV